MRVRIENVVNLKIKPVRPVGRSDIQMPFVREIEILTGSGEAMNLELGAWDARNLVEEQDDD